MSQRVEQASSRLRAELAALETSVNVDAMTWALGGVELILQRGRPHGLVWKRSGAWGAC